jgi:hypothetical protein
MVFVTVHIVKLRILGLLMLQLNLQLLASSSGTILCPDNDLKVNINNALLSPYVIRLNHATTPGS